MLKAHEAKTIAEDSQLITDTDRHRLHNQITEEAKEGKKSTVVKILCPSAPRLVAIERFLVQHGYKAVIGTSVRNEPVDWITVSWENAR